MKFLLIVALSFCFFLKNVSANYPDLSDWLDAKDFVSVQAAPLYRAAHLVLLLKEGHVVKARGREYRVCYENAAEETKISELLATIEDSIEAAASALKEQKIIVTRKDDSYQIFQKPAEKSGKKGGKKNDEKYNFKIIPVIKVEDFRALQHMLHGEFLQRQFKISVQDAESIEFLKDSHNFEVFIRALTENPIIELTLAGIKFGGNRLQKLTQALKSDGMHNIEALSFKDNRFSHYDIELLKDAFVNLAKLKKVQMTGHQFDHQALIHLINTLNNVVNLESLKLDGNGIDAAAIGGLFHFKHVALQKIKFLSLSGNPLTPEGFNTVMDNLLLMEHLEVLEIENVMTPTTAGTLKIIETLNSMALSMIRTRLSHPLKKVVLGTTSQRLAKGVQEKLSLSFADFKGVSYERANSWTVVGEGLLDAANMTGGVLDLTWSLMGGGSLKAD